tara:strand:+ start:483 stop:1619 length:1137 start_codon:yes stop_codon:yes gene_type:complete
MSPIQQMLFAVSSGGGSRASDECFACWVKYTDNQGNGKSSYIVTNDEFSSTTVHDGEDDINSTMGNWCCSGDYIHFSGYWGPHHMIKVSDLTHTDGGPSPDYYNRSPFTYDSNYEDNMVSTYWGGYMSPKYTTNNANTPNPSFSTPTYSGFSMTRGYIHGAATLDGVTAIAIGTNDSGVEGSRIIRSTNGGATFTEHNIQTYYSFGGYLGAYPDYDGGKFMWWRLNASSSNSGTNSTYSSSNATSWTLEGSQSNGPGAPSYHGYPDGLEIVYNKETSKFYYAWASTTLKESSDGVTWTNVTLPYTTNQVAVMKNGDMVGLTIDGTNAKFYKYTLSGSSITWSSATLLNTTAISSNIASYGGYAALCGFYAPSYGGFQE